MTDPGALNIVPNPPVPAAEDIVLKMDVGVYSKKRLWDEPFKPTSTYTFNFARTTNLRDYATAISSIVNEVWNYAESERAIGAEVTLHTAVWLDNPTHPTTGKGVVRLPKGHHDSALSDQEFSSATILQEHLTTIVVDLKTKAKY